MAGTTGNTAWDAIFPQDATIKIERKGEGAIQIITTDVTNVSDGGGAKNTESIPHFGNAYLTVVKPQEDFEVGFEVDVKDTRWMQTMTDTITATPGSPSLGSYIEVASGGDQDEYKVKVEWKVGSDAYKLLYYNARAVTFEKDNPADDRLMGTITFNLSPTDSSSNAQRYEMETSDTFAASIGSSATGSYGSRETVFDALFSYTVGGML